MQKQIILVFHFDISIIYGQGNFSDMQIVNSPAYIIMDIKEALSVPGKQI